MFFYPWYGRIATEYDESYSLLEMIGNLTKRTHQLEAAMENTTSIINLLSAKIDALTMDVQYIDNKAETTIDIYKNKQYILKNNATKLKLLAKHYIHDCHCENCTCNIESKDGFICEIAIPFENFNDISEIIETEGFTLAWCNDTSVEDKTNVTVVIWWDGTRFCAAIGKYSNDEIEIGE